MNIDWWGTRIMRYMVGPSVIGWELLVDDGRNLAIAILGFMLTMSMDVRAVVKDLIRSARFERMSAQEMIERLPAEDQKALKEMVGDDDMMDRLGRKVIELQERLDAQERSRSSGSRSPDEEQFG